MIGSQRSDEPRNSGRKRNNRNRDRDGKRRKKCKKQRYRDYFIEEHGCRSKKPYKMAKCVGPEGSDSDQCVPTRIKTRKIKFVCPDGSTPRKEVELVRKCGRKKNNWG